jgi:hypothetical protein
MRSGRRNAGQALADFGIFFGPERWPLLSWRGRSNSTKFIADPVPQNRSLPNRKSSATVTAAEISNDPRQPSRFEKKKNMLRWASVIGPAVARP